MSIGFHRDTVTVLDAALVTDGYGNPVPDWANATETEVTECRLQPERGTEYLTDREAVTTRWRLFGPAGMPIQDTSRVRHNGIVYDVDGSVERWPSPTGALAHTEALLRRAKG